MTKLHLGVIDAPYTSNPVHKDHRSPNTTTGDVAEILEKKYGVMLAYFKSHQSEVTEAMEKSVEKALDSIMNGGDPGVSPFASAEAFIDQDFRHFLSNSEIEKLGIAGVPTQAALDGVSHRFKNPRYIKKGKKRVQRPRRPSFIDTGLYQSHMKSWFE